MSDLIVEARDLKKSYKLGEKYVEALKGVSFEIQRGEFVAFIGSSGSGKTTVLNLIGGLDEPSSGILKVQGQSITEKTDDELSDFRRRHLGFVFQTFNLIPVLSALENVEYPLMHFGLSVEEVRERAERALKLVGLEKFGDHRPQQLSGGQRQRVAIARALVHQPQLIVADEPTANLDRKTAVEIVEHMRSLNQETGVTFVFSTHDAVVYERASRKISLIDGVIV